ncbi:TetR-like C-terminal domain-containing protein [Acinetobacter calcoaceticus]|uniref:AcrR family transcriptional regulator n=1 Tax=Acinetobacter calcoaceticus TaxID=471 RepID=A0ABD5AIH2_ACICA|nr:TetR-like C-terminal domain-containing protein [Acinetobacter calcoaceticus]MDP9802191.1 AcrR family transcriptional regulator [Acinetobacter calcoaceticus]
MEAGQSTMGVYTHFGGVPELLQAIADEGFTQQAKLFRSIENTNDPMTNMCLMALECRNFAMANPHLYDLMFGLSIQGRYTPFRRSESSANESTEAFKNSYSYLRQECANLIETKYIRDIDPDVMAAQLWSALHGFIMLELGQHFSCSNPINEILIPMCINLIVGLGAEPQMAENAASKALTICNSKNIV